MAFRHLEWSRKDEDEDDNENENENRSYEVDDDLTDLKRAEERMNQSTTPPASVPLPLPSSLHFSESSSALGCDPNTVYSSVSSSSSAFLASTVQGQARWRNLPPPSNASRAASWGVTVENHDHSVDHSTIALTSSSTFSPASTAVTLSVAGNPTSLSAIRSSRELRSISLDMSDSELNSAGKTAMKRSVQPSVTVPKKYLAPTIDLMTEAHSAQEIVGLEQKESELASANATIRLLQRQLKRVETQVKDLIPLPDSFSSASSSFSSSAVGSSSLDRQKELLAHKLNAEKLSADEARTENAYLHMVVESQQKIIARLEERNSKLKSAINETVKSLEMELKEQQMQVQRLNNKLKIQNFEVELAVNNRKQKQDPKRTQILPTSQTFSVNNEYSSKISSKLFKVKSPEINENEVEEKKNKNEKESKQIEEKKYEEFPTQGQSCQIEEKSAQPDETHTHSLQLFTEHLEWCLQKPKFPPDFTSDVIIRPASPLHPNLAAARSALRQHFPLPKFTLSQPSFAANISFQEELAIIAGFDFLRNCWNKLTALLPSNLRSAVQQRKTSTDYSNHGLLENANCQLCYVQRGKIKCVVCKEWFCSLCCIAREVTIAHHSINSRKFAESTIKFPLFGAIWGGSQTHLCVMCWKFSCIVAAAQEYTLHNS